MILKKIYDIIYMPKVKKMEILKIKVKGIRNISEVEIVFDKMTALVGLNGYGKSNIMDAIDFGLDFIKYPQQIKNRLMSSKQNIPILKFNAGQNYEFQIEIALTANNVNYLVMYGYEFEWEKTNSPAKIINEYLKIKLDAKGQKYTSLICREETLAKYKRTETGRCDTKIKIDNDLLVINKLTAFDDLYYIDILNQINNIQFYIERHLDANPAYSPDPIVIKGFEELELGGIQNIPRAVFFLKSAYPDKFELLINSFKQLFPRIRDIDVTEHKLNYDKQKSFSFSEDAPLMYTDSIYTMTVTDDLLLQPLRFESMSDGAKRIFLMLTYAAIADVKGLSMIAMEEPENSIHPNLLQSYLDTISQLVDTCKIIFTSHSPYIIQYLNPRSIYIGITSENGSVDFRRIASSKVNALLKDAVQYDKSLGDYIFNILSTEDADESLKEYIESND
ncbi:MAG: ATP-binding protein [Ruminococcus sp.]|nr:ATP-binding protein [Ruminococcus sp.]